MTKQLQKSYFGEYNGCHVEVKTDFILQLTFHPRDSKIHYTQMFSEVQGRTNTMPGGPAIHAPGQNFWG